MKFNPEIFKAYDIRGKYGIEFDDDFAEALGAALVGELGAKKILVARDTRPSSELLAQRVLRGITTAGADAIDIGTASTPLFYFGVIHEKTEAGIMISASHLGPEFNGFKIAREGAITMGNTTGLEPIMTALHHETEIQPAGKAGNIISKNLLEQYAEFIIDHSKLHPGDIKLKVGLMGEQLPLSEIRYIFHKLGITETKDTPDVIFELDPDGDRLMVHDGQGKLIRGDLFGGAFVMHFFQGKKIVYDIRYCRDVLQYLLSHGVSLTPSKIGHTLIKKVMRENNLDFGAEGSGHMFFKEAGYVEATALMMLKTLIMLSETGKTINELVAPLDTWAYSGEINTPLVSRSDIDPILASLRRCYADGNASTLDGLKIEYPDWGFFVRPSNTEALIRLILEAKTKELMDEKVKEVQAFIKA